MIRSLNVIRFAATLSMREFFVMYPTKVYLLSWLPRVGGQLAFFAFALHYVGNEQATRFALIGNGVYLAALTVISFVAISYMLERGIGSMPLLLASPTSPFLVLCARNAGMAWHGFTTGFISLAAALAFLGESVTIQEALFLLIALGSVVISGYAIGLAIGATSLLVRGFHNVLANIVSYTILAFAGVNVPLTVLPDWVGAVAKILPVTHALLGVRQVLDGTNQEAGWQGVAIELLVAVAYLALAYLITRYLIYRSRQRANLDFI